MEDSNELNEEPEINSSLPIKVKSETCPVCECKFDPNLNDCVRKGLMYKCGLCHRTFRKAKELKLHFNHHLNEYPFTCHICFEGFQGNGTLNIHKRTCHPTETSNHDEDQDKAKRFQCELCLKRFLLNFVNN